jgi:hypothetical protein
VFFTHRNVLLLSKWVNGFTGVKQRLVERYNRGVQKAKLQTSDLKLETSNPQTSNPTKNNKQQIPPKLTFLIIHPLSFK